MIKPIRDKEYVSKRTGRFVKVKKVIKNQNTVIFWDNRPCHLDKFHLKYKHVNPELPVSGSTN